MKINLFLSFSIFIISFNCLTINAHAKDSLYVNINDLSPKVKSIFLSDKGIISIISISMKNKYENVFRYGCDPSNFKVFIKNKIRTNKNNLLAYSKLNEMLNKDFLKIATKYEVFFILTEDKNNFYAINVRPIIPNKFFIGM